MNKYSLNIAITSGVFGLSLCTAAHAELIKDTTATLEARNYYFNRDFRQEGASQSKREEWAQGFILRVDSGYTEGPVGVGVDAIGMFGFKLDSGGGTAGTNLLVPDRSGGSQDNSSDLAVAAKAKYSNTAVRAGSMQFKNMAVSSSDGRLLPQVFRGGQLISTEIERLLIDGGYLSQVNNRDSSDFEDIKMISGGKRGINVRGDNASDSFQFLGGSYRLTEDLTASYYYSNLEDLYKQNSFNLVQILPLGEGQSLKADLRYARSTDDGRSNVDNKSMGAMFTYSLNSHSFGLGYQKMSGDTGAAYIGGTDPFLVNYVQISDFANKDESSWQARYDYDFKGVGIPGLKFMTRYLNGDNVDLGAAAGDGKEWERDIELKYVFQQGPMKNFSVRWRNAMVRSNFTNDIDENRLILSYTLPLL
ncbi:OprD family porin [Pseudomonas segetis]|uniref:Outer membrane porin, OprD family n=1 Tax=Pseudomonas segetis TaxID=298908 RepID=A0A239BX63_9PSED|nr:OprD family porin [Pseudomonas segetis]SNS12232.1 outer membrane porin, OprD family [Pseudomonas segetis]